MAKIKLTKNELKKQKDALKRFVRYLPTLLLKKRQLQLVISQVNSQLAEIQSSYDALRRELNSWIAVFGEEVGLEKLLRLESVRISDGNIAGVDIPVFEGVDFWAGDYDLAVMPLWIDRGLGVLRDLIALDVEIKTLEEQRRLLEEELRITTQRVNLFEKVKIPETRENIRRIRIYLGDEQTAAVVRGKIAKGKLVRI